MLRCRGKVLRSVLCMGMVCLLAACGGGDGQAVSQTSEPYNPFSAEAGATANGEQGKPAQPLGASVPVGIDNGSSGETGTGIQSGNEQDIENCPPGYRWVEAS